MVTIGTLLVTDEHQANPAIHRTCAKSRAGPVILNVSHMGDFALAVIISAGDLVAYIIGKVLGRTFHLDREKAQKVGQIVFASAVIGAGLFVTILYS